MTNEERLDFCHRDYFRLFRLNVEQYGEILVAQAFCGRKMGDEQHGYDVKVGTSDFLRVLHRNGKDLGPLAVDEEDIRIEVKSKLSHTLGGKAKVIGKAEVINIKEAKLTPLGMTHLAVVLVYPGSRANRDIHEEGLIADAWLLTRQRACAMRAETSRKGKSLSVREIRTMATNNHDIIDIKPLLAPVTEAPLMEMLVKARASWFD